MPSVDLRIAEIARTVKARRKLLGLTQAELAELVGVSPTFVFELENAKPTVSLNRVIAVLVGLGLQLELRVGVNE